MKIGVFHVDTKTLDSECGYLCAKHMVRSVREHMDGVPVIHFTDDRSRPIEGVDAVERRSKAPMAQLRMQHHAGVRGDWLFVDTDVLFQQDVRSVFRKDFEIAVADRDWTHLKPAAGFTEEMPFNMGVVFSRCPLFWFEIEARLATLPKPERRWMGDQQVFCDVIGEGKYHVATISGSRYNFPPSLDDTDTASQALEQQAAIIHFKGPRRKPMMLKRIQESIVCV